MRIGTYLLLIAAVVAITLMTACTKTNQDKCTNDLEHCHLVDSDNIRQFNDNCKKLAACMKVDWEIVHFSNQEFNPYACSLSKKGNKYVKSIYMYPKGELSFGRVTFNRMENEIDVCEMMTETGHFSDKYHEQMEEVFKEIRKAQDEARKRNNPPQPPPMKIREEK